MIILNDKSVPFIHLVALTSTFMDPADSDDCYSNDEEYFLDICRAGELEELKEFITGLK